MFNVTVYLKNYPIPEYIDKVKNEPTIVAEHNVLFIKKDDNFSYTYPMENIYKITTVRIDD